MKGAVKKGSVRCDETCLLNLANRGLFVNVVRAVTSVRENNKLQSMWGVLKLRGHISLSRNFSRGGVLLH